MALVEPRKRRAAVKPAIKDMSDSEEDVRNVPMKRARKSSSDDEFYEAKDEAAKRPRTRAPAKPKAATKPRVTKTKSSPSKRTLQSKVPRRTVPKKEDSGEEDTFSENGPRKLEGYEDAADDINNHEEPMPGPAESLPARVQMEWKESDLLAENEGLDKWVANNLVKLFEEDNTIPFIARYRKEMTGNMEPDQLRLAKESYNEIKVIQHRASTMIKSIDKMGKLTSTLRRSIVCARSMGELELINTPFKVGGKRTHAERARKLGLENAAHLILNGTERLSLAAFVNEDKEGLRDVKEVQLGIQHIIADIISKDRSVLDFISDLRKSVDIRLESKRAKTTLTKALGKTTKREKGSLGDKPLTAAEKKELKAKADEESKYQHYFDFSMKIQFIKPHQVLAINRGVNLKELSVCVTVPNFVQDKLISFCLTHWLSKGVQYELRSAILTDSVRDSYSRLIHPLIARQVRSELNQNAERASIKVFAENLKKLLLMPPYRGHVVLGVDPGFRNGCKVALIGLSGEVLETGFFNLNYGRRTWDLRDDGDAQWLKEIMTKYRCEVVALGNGTACRETEEYFSELLQTGFFKPLDVSYTIVSEQGASIYSCSKEAQKEFPDMDPNLISAVSIARRLQEPLAELVKVEPKHLGVGMYQHDLSEKKLSGTLSEVVVECVSFVGVDVNTAPLCLLRLVAGMNSSRAEKIVEHRQKHGPFISRDDLKKVQGVGQKSFQQCAGFIRVNPETIESRTMRKFNPLDRTWIHPESYSFAMRFLNHCKVKAEDIGSPHCISSIAQAVKCAGGVQSLAAMLNEKIALVQLVVDGLQVPLNHDIRSEFEKPLFRKGLTNINELRSGDILTGRITNTTDFGAFVDIGVGRNGLIHKTGMSGKRPQLGDRVQVKVKNVELARQRIGLELLAIL